MRKEWENRRIGTQETSRLGEQENRRRKEQENFFRKDFSFWTACMAQMNLHRPYGRRKEGRAPWLTLTLHCQCFADTTTHRRTWIGHYVEEHNCQEIQNAKVCPTGIFKKKPSDDIFFIFFFHFVFHFFDLR